MRLKIQRFESKPVCGFSVFCICSPYILFYINFIKKETESKIPHLCFISYKKRKLKVKLSWVKACERKKRAFFVPFTLSEKSFFNICVLSQCIVYWIHFQNINTITYQKTLLHILLLLVFKIVESLQCILK